MIIRTQVLLFLFCFLFLCGKASNAQSTNDTAFINQLNKQSLDLLTANPDSAKKLAQQAIARSEKINYLQGLGDGYSRLGVIEKYAGKYDTSILLFKKSLSFRLQLKNPIHIGKCYTNIGTVYDRKSDFPSALFYQLKALRIFEGTSDSANLGLTLGNVGLVYQHSKNYAQAEKYYKHSLSTYTSINDSIGIIRALSNLGSLFVDMEKYSVAKNILKQVILYAEAHASNSQLATSCNNLGLVYKAELKTDSALFFLHRAAILDSTLNLKKEQAVAIGNIGVLHQDQGNFIKAIYFLEKSITLTKEVGDKKLTTTNYGNLARAYSSSGDFVAAYEAQTNYQLYNDSVYNEEKAKSFTEMQTKYETEKKEKEIVLLNQKNRLQRLQKNIFLGGAIALIIFAAWLFIFFRQKQRIKAQQEAIEKQRAIENVRSRISIDMHDEIGSGLTKLSLMSERVKMKLKSIQNEEEPLLDKISKSSREISGNLSEIIWTVNPKHDNLASMLSYFRNYVTKFFEDTSVGYKIDFMDHVPEFQIHPDLKRNLFLVLKESLNNILKYAQAKNVNVHFSLKGDQFNFDITDDGIGMKDLNGREFGNGLKNMKNRIESVNGSFDIQSAENKGTRIFICGKLYY